MKVENCEAAIHRFVPSRVEGVTEVSEVVVHPDRLELVHSTTRRVIHLIDIARWPWPKQFWRVIHTIGIRPKWLPVADRDWFHVPRDRFFRFYTSPPITIFMPADETAEYGPSHFLRIQQVFLAAGFHTFDLG
jgi:hypothetical protein